MVCRCAGWDVGPAPVVVAGSGVKYMARLVTSLILALDSDLHLSLRDVVRPGWILSGVDVNVVEAEGRNRRKLLMYSQEECLFYNIQYVYTVWIYGKKLLILKGHFI